MSTPQEAKEDTYRDGKMSKGEIAEGGERKREREKRERREKQGTS
jgi:hypothetical protein